MKIEVDREKFLAAFELVTSIAPRRHAKQILKFVKLEVTEISCVLCATDLDVGIRYEVPGVEVSEPGESLLPAELFGTILRTAVYDKTLCIVSVGELLVVRGDRCDFELPTEDVGGFPRIPAFDSPAYFELAGEALHLLLHRTLFAADNESQRYALGGIKLETDGKQMIAVASDGRRLAKMSVPVQAVGEPEPFDKVVANETVRTVIIPSHGVQLIERVLESVPYKNGEVLIACDRDVVTLRFNRATLAVRILEGRFPRWRDVIPANRESTKIEIQVAPFAAVVEQAKAFALPERRGVDFTFGQGELLLTVQNKDIGGGNGRIGLPIAYDGPLISITLDPTFLTECCGVLFPQQCFTIDLVDGDTLASFTTDDGYFYGVMPLARDK